MTSLSFAKHHDDFFAVGEDHQSARSVPPGLNLEYFGGGKTSTSTSSVSVPPEVLARYNAVNSIAQNAAGIKQTAQTNADGTPVLDSSGNPQYNYSMGQYTPYTGEFVAGVNNQENSAIQNINSSANQAQSSIASGQADVNAGLGAGAGLVNQSLGTMGAAASQGQDLYGQSLGTIGSAAGQAANQYGTLYGNINAAQDVGNNYANAANQAISGSVNAAAPLMQAGVGLTAQGLGAGQQYANQAQSYLGGGTQNVDPSQFSQSAVNQYLSPYLNNVVQSQLGLMNNQNAQQQSALKGNAIASGAFGGDRAGIAQANLMGQQSLANQATLANTLQQGYGQALGAFQQQQGVNLQAGQANRAAQQFGEQASAALGQQQYAQSLGAGQQLSNIGNQLYSQNLGQGQALAGLGQQQYAQGLGAAQAQAGLVGQDYQMGAQQAGLQQSAAQGLFNQGAQNAAFQGQAGQNLFNMNQQAGMNTANLGLQAQQANLQGAQAQLGAGQLQQQTQQAQDQAVYNQFLQQQGYPFQVAQYLANIAEGTGALSGSTTTSTQPASFFGGSDRRLKKDIQKLGKTDDGLPIYKFRYKDDPEGLPRIGFMADEVEKKHPEAVKEMGGYKAVDYDKAARPKRADGGLVNPDMIELLKAHAMMYGQGNKGLGAVGAGGVGAPGFVPQANLPVGQLMTAKVPTPPQSGLKEAANDASAIAGLAGKGKDAWDWLKKNGPDLSSFTGSSSSGSDSSFAKGGLVPHYAGGGEAPMPEDVDPYGTPGDPATEGYLAKTMKGMEKPGKLAVADAPNSSGGSGLGDIASLAGSAAKIFSLFALKNGGLVPRPHKAGGGGTEGGNDDNSNDIPDDVQALSPDDYKPMVVQAAKRHNVDPDSLAKIVQAESSFRPQLGDDGSSAGLAQMHVAGISPKYPNPGLGDAYFEKRMPDQKLSPQEKIAYLNDPKNQADVLDFAAEHASKNGFGAWSTAKGLGLAGNRPSSGAVPAEGTGIPPSARGADWNDTGSLSDKISSKMSDPNVILSILAGLGTMAGSNSRYLGSAILQGLGGGASTYAALNNQNLNRGIQQQRVGIEQTKMNLEMAMQLRQMNATRAASGLPPLSMDDLKSGVVPGLGVATETPKTSSATKAPDTGLNPPLKPAEAPLPTPQSAGLSPSAPAPAAPSAPMSMPPEALAAKPVTPAQPGAVTSPLVAPLPAAPTASANTPASPDQEFWNNVDPAWDPRNAIAKAKSFDDLAQQYANQAKIFGTAGDAARMQAFQQQSQQAQAQAETMRQRAQALTKDQVMMKDGTMKYPPSFIQSQADAAAAKTTAERNATNATTLREVTPEAGGPKILRTDADVINDINAAKANPAPGAGSPLGPVAAPPANLEKRREEIDKSELGMRDQFQARQVARARVDNLSNLIEKYESGAFADNKAGLVAAARAAGFEINPGAASDPTLFQEFTKDSMKNIFDDAKSLGGRILVTELAGLAKTSADPTIQPGSNSYILGQTKGLLNYEDDYFRDYTKWREQNPTSAYPERFDVEWVKAHPLKEYMDEGKLGVAAKGEPLPRTPDEAVDRKKYITPKGPLFWDAQKNGFVKTQPPKRTGTNG